MLELGLCTCETKEAESKKILKIMVESNHNDSLSHKWSNRIGFEVL